MTARKPAVTPEWTQQESDRDWSAFIGPAIAATVVLVAAFVWFVKSLIDSGSIAGKILFALLAVFAIVSVGCLIVTAIAGARGAWNRSARVMPKSDGRVPLLYSHLDAEQAAVMLMDRLTHARVLEAGRSLPPGVQSVSQSQSTSTFDAVPDEPEQIALTADALVKWGDLERAGEIRSDAAPVVGWDVLAGKLLRLDWKTQLGSIVVVGMSGSGKTTFALGLGMQSVPDGGKLIVCDRHAEDEDASLGARIDVLKAAYLVPMAQSDAEIVDALKAAEEVLRDRIGGNRDRSPLVVMVEELTSLMQRVGPDIAPILIQIGNEGRKFGVNAITFAQFGSKKDLGDFRDAASSTFVFRSRPDHARMALGYTPEIDIRQYADGECFIQSRRDAFERVQTPWIETADIATFAQHVTEGEQPEPAKLTKAQLVLVPESAPDGVRWGISADDEDQFTPEEELRVVQLYSIGKSPQDIVHAMRGVPPGGTRRYRKLKTAVESIVRVRLRDASGEE